MTREAQDDAETLWTTVQAGLEDIMPKTYRLGVVGFAHMHVNELMRVFAELPNVEWVACADTKPQQPEMVEARFTRDWNKRHAHEEIGIPTVYDDYREMLDRERF